MKKRLNFQVILFALLLFITPNLGFAQPVCIAALNVSLNGDGEIIIYPGDVFQYNDFSATSISKDGINFSSFITFDCSEVGENAVSVHGTVDGEEQLCESVLNVQDLISPIAIVQANFTINLASETDIYTLEVSDIDEGSYDNCGIASYVLSQTEFSIDDWGGNTIVLTALDESGNESQAWTALTVLVDGLTAPFSCINGLNVAASPFGAPVTVYPNDFNATDTQYDEMFISVDGGLSYVSSIDLTCDDLSSTPQEVHIQAFLNGEEYNCQSILTFLDNTPPVAVAEETVILVLDENGEATLTIEMVDEGSYDNCSGSDITYELSQTEFTITDAGTHTVVMTVTDASGNTNQVWTTVQVTDGTDCNFPFSILWPANITIYDADATADDVSPEGLVDNFGYSYVQANPIIPDFCGNIAFTYNDVVIYSPEITKIVRTWTALNWNTGGVITYHQLIKIIHDTTLLNCVEGLSISVVDGDVPIFPIDVLLNYLGNPDDLFLFILDENESLVPGNIITTDYVGQTLTYFINDNISSCSGDIIVNFNDFPCPLNENEISWPLSQIEISNPTQSPTLLLPEYLSLEYGFAPSEVNVIIDNACAIASSNYEDEVFNYPNGYFQIIRTFTLIDWQTFNPETLEGYWTFTQIINNGVNPLSLICDILPRTADVGDCDSGHTLDDDVEWPADIFIADHRITPDELVNFSSVDMLDASPSFYNTPTDYTVTYTDFLVGLTTEEITVGRVWLVTNTVYNLTWTYSQEIIIDITSFSDLVTVNTAGLRSMPNVNINNEFLTNGNGIAYVTSPSINSISYEDEVNNGINILDLVLTSHHLLEAIEFTSSQKSAGDINQDEEISQADLTALQNMILLSNDNGWIFVDETENLGTEPMPKAHFSAFKRGDVNDSALLFGETIEVSNESEFTFNDDLINAGESYEIPVYLNTEINAYGVEFHIQVDESILTIDNISSDYFNENIFWNTDENGLVLLIRSELVSEILGGEDALPVFTIHATAASNGLLHQGFDFDNQYARIATTDYELITLPGNIDNLIPTGTRDETLSVVKVYPNPASAFIHINTDKLTLNGDFIFDLRTFTGQSVLKTVNQNKIDVSNLAAGMYFYTIAIDGFEMTRKISINR